jgi:hypothetical protein
MVPRLGAGPGFLPLQKRFSEPVYSFVLKRFGW